MKADELREKYLSFYQTKGHSRQASDVLVPTWDPSVLFTPAGMNPFKDHFLGKVKLEFTRATTCQKCLRTGDIDNVGRTAYHHTFFEMLGNFSFGDYFKTEAISWAWEFLTDKKWLGIDPARLSVTVYKDDDEAASIWNEKIGLPTARIARMDEDENFWPASAPSQGPDGVCGPCSEIYYQLDSGKSVEIWNLVFTQFNRVGEPPDNLRPLPSKNIDTGMGMERTASVLQGVPSNFHIDILFPIVKAAAEVVGMEYSYESDNGRRLRRITDHVRACTFAIHENVYPGPKKARYVIKRLVRRAVLDGHQMGMREPFLYQLVPVVADMMKAVYPELTETVTRVAQVLKTEEADFFNTIDAGLARIQKVFSDLESNKRGMVDGREAATLYQTYGVPPELFQGLAAERNLTFDWDGYKQAMSEHEIISGTGRKELFQTGPIETLKEALFRSDFLGYETTSAPCVIKGIIVGKPENDRLISTLKSDSASSEPVRIVLDRSPFYGESGGQVGDSGVLEANGVLFRVKDTQRHGELIVHSGHLEKGELREGMEVTAKVDESRRSAIRRAHSATHMLHHALQKTLGGHAQQQGSKVDADWLRFDFSNQDALEETQLSSIESIVNDRVHEASPIRAELLPLADARKAGAMMLFGEKYPDPVRMVSMGAFSKELCGGTHLQRTDEVEAFELISEESVSAGTRRIEAYTGSRAKEHRELVQKIAQEAAKILGCKVEQLAQGVVDAMHVTRKLKKQLSGGGESQEAAPKVSVVSSGDSYRDLRLCLKTAARALNVGLLEVPARLESILDEQVSLRSQLEVLAKSGQTSAADLLATSELVSGVRVVVAETPGANPNLMRQWIDQIRKTQAEPTAVLLGSRAGDDKVLLVCGLSKELTDRKLSAGGWITPVAEIVGGGGGGKPDLAQAGGRFPDKLPEALEKAKTVIRTLVGG
ncbi:MAG: alanine--tRNA ligase [Pirellulales bacterium]